MKNMSSVLVTKTKWHITIAKQKKKKKKKKKKKTNKTFKIGISGFLYI